MIFTRTIKISLLLAGLLLLGLEKGKAEGLLLIKQYSWQQESAATPLPYQTISRFSTVYNIRTNKGRSMRINTPLIVRDVDFEQIPLPNQITTDAEQEVLASAVEDLQQIVETWPAARPYLLPKMAPLTEALRRYSQGEVCEAGEWMSKAEHRQRKQAAFQAEQAAEKQRNEVEQRKRQEAAARKKEELELEKQRIESEEKIRLAAIQAAEAESARAKIELQRQQELAAERERQQQAAIDALAAQHAAYVAKYAEDPSVEPTGLQVTDPPSFKETLDFINGKIAKCGGNLRFGQNCQRFVLISNRHIRVFSASDFPTEARIAEQQTSGGLRLYVVVEARNSQKKVETIAIEPRTPEEIAASTYSPNLSIAVENQTDAEKVQKALNHLIKMFGGESELF